MNAIISLLSDAALEELERSILDGTLLGSIEQELDRRWGKLSASESVPDPTESSLEPMPF